MTRVLLVDDDRYILRALEKLMAAEGYYSHSAVSAEEARRALTGEPFDMMVLDVGLPDMDGFALCRQVRARHTLPILFLTARDDSADKVIGLEVGGDDYLTKPFAPRELVARVRAQLRRSTEYSQPLRASNQIVFGTLLVDIDRHDAFRKEQPCRLTEREFSLLHLMARHRDKALATSWIFENIWGFGADMGVKTLAVYVRRVRSKIEADPDKPAHLLTVRGFGYKLTSDT